MSSEETRPEKAEEVPEKVPAAEQVSEEASELAEEGDLEGEAAGKEEATPEEIPSAAPEDFQELPAEVKAPSEGGAWAAEDTTDNDRLMAGLAYVSQVVIPVLVPVVMLLAEESKERPFQKYHAGQSLGFLVVAVIYEVLAAIVYCGLTAITSNCLACVLWLIFLLPVVPALFYAYQAYQGLYFKIPILTDFLLQSNWLEMPPA